MTSSASVPLARSRRDRVLGGVCGGLAERLGVDPLVVRILAVVLAVFSGGGAVLAYLALWVFVPPAGQSLPAAQLPAAQLPPAPAPPARPADGPTTEGTPAGPRTAWTAVGGELKTLAGELRRPRPSEPGQDTGIDTGIDTGAATGVGTAEAAGTPVAGTAPGGPAAGADSRPAPLQAADRALTSVGDRLRTPAVQHSARTAANRLSDAVRVSADGISRRTRRS